MEFRTDQPGVLASRTLRETGSAHIDEVDLYDELATFSALSPEEQRKELERETSQIAAAPADVLKTTSPLEVIDLGTITNEKCELKCEGCGAASSLEELFCWSCGQLLGEMD